jgi:cytochrome c-type biogenesis protein CcmH
VKPLTSRDAVPPGGETAGGDQALPPGHPPIQSQGMGSAPATSGASVSGTITVSSELQSRLAPGDVLYVMAKKDGTTLAVQKVDSPTFPFTFEVSEGHAMVGGTTLEGPVDIVARLSKTGDAIPSAGDLEGTATGVAVPSTGITVTITEVRQ